MSKSKKINQLEKDAISHLYKAFDILEGLYSNIPQCCIEGFLSGRTYMNVYNTLSQKDKKKLDKFHYVPCEKCFKNNKVNKIKENGTSLTGQMLFTLIDYLKNKETDK